MNASPDIAEGPVYAIGPPYKVPAGKDIWWAVDLSDDRTVAHETRGASEWFYREHRKPEEMR